jgi:hypothetical protein
VSTSLVYYGNVTLSNRTVYGVWDDDPGPLTLRDIAAIFVRGTGTAIFLGAVAVVAWADPVTFLTSAVPAFVIALAMGAATR